MRPERHGFNPCVGKIPWREEMATHSIFLPEELHGQKKKKRIAWTEEPGRLQYNPWGWTGLSMQAHYCTMQEGFSSREQTGK